MSRRHQAEKRVVLEDPKYKSVLLSKFINSIMIGGKKATARDIVYGAFEIVAAKLKRDALEVFNESISKVEPKMEVKSRRVGGATYQVPIDVAPHRSRTLALRWITAAVNKRNEKTAVERLAAEMMDITNDRGASLKTKENTHKMAEANRAFAHYRW